MMNNSRRLNIIAFATILLSAALQSFSHFVLEDKQAGWFVAVEVFIVVSALIGFVYNAIGEKVQTSDHRELLDRTNILARHKTDNTSGNAFFQEAETLLAKGDEEEACRNYERAHEADRNDISSLLKMGSLYYTKSIRAIAIDNVDKARFMDRAEYAFSHALDIDSTNVDAKDGVGLVLDQTGKDVERALQLFLEVVNDAPARPFAHSNLGSAYLHLGMHDEAKDEFVKEIHVGNEFSGIHYLGTYYQATSQYLQAGTCYEYLLAVSDASLATYNPAAHALVTYNLVLCLLNAGAFIEAAHVAATTERELRDLGRSFPQRIRKALRRSSKAPLIYLVRKASFTIRRLCHLPAGNGAATYTLHLAQAHLHQGHIAEAMSELSLAMRIEPQSALAHALFGFLVHGLNGRQTLSICHEAVRLAKRNRDNNALLIATKIIEDTEEEGKPLSFSDDETYIMSLGRKALALAYYRYKGESSWPFVDSPFTPVLTLAHIATNGGETLCAVHEADGTWKFVDSSSYEREDMIMTIFMIVAMKDPSIALLNDLPPGWGATRASKNDLWHKERFEPNDRSPTLSEVMEDQRVQELPS